ncbi:glycosyltransferase [Candidatus Saccharibacteria bacterium]|nr:glycosyltransferase [Candidatus Saccharibacteria bacterium]
MLKKIDLWPRSIEGYRSIMDAGLLNEIYSSAGQLKGKRVLHINSTPNRGGVAEILANLIPLLKGLGIDAEWYSLHNVPSNFYRVTKAIHNGLQGHPRPLPQSDWKVYEDFNRKLAKQLDPQNWDFIFIQDHQLTAALSFLPSKGKSKWLWRSHTDSINTKPEYQQRFLEYLQPYDGAIFTMREYVFKDSHLKHLMISPPAIEGLNPKNLPMSKIEARRIIGKFGIDTSCPLITQISRFDPWKDLPGVVEAWKLAKAKVPKIQLAIVGNFTVDDLQAKMILSQVRKAASGLPDVHIITNQAGPRAIKAFQTASDIILQKSIREGFGLTVSEAMWSKTPVIGGNVGGIILQIIHNKNGYLVNDVEDCAKRIVELIQDLRKRRNMGKAGQRHVRENFLLPRLVRDELKFMLEVSS